MAAQITCPRCNHHNPLGFNFCSSCGFELSAPVEDATATHSLEELEAASLEEEPTVQADTGHPMFVVRRGPKAGSRYSLDTPRVQIGRHPDSDIFLDDVTVSRRHAEVSVAGPEASVADAGSLNGTYVNRNLIESSVLRDGDEVQIGKFKLVFVAVQNG